MGARRSAAVGEGLPRWSPFSRASRIETGESTSVFCFVKRRCGLLRGACTQARQLEGAEQASILHTSWTHGGVVSRWTLFAERQHESLKVPVCMYASLQKCCVSVWDYSPDLIFLWEGLPSKRADLTPSDQTQPPFCVRLHLPKVVFPRVGFTGCDETWRLNTAKYPNTYNRIIRTTMLPPHTCGRDSPSDRQQPKNSPSG